MYERITISCKPVREKRCKVYIGLFTILHHIPKAGPHGLLGLDLIPGFLRFSQVFSTPHLLQLQNNHRGARGEYASHPPVTGRPPRVAQLSHSLYPAQK